MTINKLGNPLLEKAIQGAWARNEVLANNIANIDTPNYKRQDVNFEDYLKAAVKKDAIAGFVSNPKHITISSPSVSDINYKVSKDFDSTNMRIDGNNVDIDVEMAEMAKNQILFNTYTTLMNGHFSKLRIAIKEGR